MKRKINSGYLLIFSAGLLWGFIGLFVKQLEQSGATPVITSFLRVFFSCVIMLPLCVLRGGWRSVRIDRRALLFCVLLGVICHGVYNIFYSLAVTLAGVSVSAVLLNIAPVFTLLCSALCFGERITGRKLFAIAVNVLGCVLTATNGRLDGAAFSLMGILFGVGAGLCYAMTAIFGRFAADRADPFVMSMYSYLAASILLFLWMRPWSQTVVFSGSVFLWGFLYALIPTSLAYILYYLGLKKVRESSKVPVIASVETMVAAVIGIVLYHESIGVFSLLGIILVIASIFVMNSGDRRKTSSSSDTLVRKTNMPSNELLDVQREYARGGKVKSLTIHLISDRHHIRPF